MKNVNAVIIFLTVLIIHVGAIFANSIVLQLATKPLLMLLLIIYFLQSTITANPGLRKCIAGGLLFSWIGDLLLMFETNTEVFFLAGLCSFLLAHVFYIFFFHSVRVHENIRGRIVLLLPVIAYYTTLMVILSPSLGDMKLPVRIYGVVICFMLMLALHMLYIKDKRAGILMAIGALLFVMSDSVLAINKFYKPVKGAKVVIMLTYGIAQLMIVRGSIQYLAKTGKRQSA
jgi:uncharacterized membrane protein YhhN